MYIYTYNIYVSIYKFITLIYVELVVNRVTKLMHNLIINLKKNIFSNFFYKRLLCRSQPSNENQYNRIINNL